ncbi:MAG: hypothetical protein IKT65_00085 [Clostridia bacterium]|nr:hypothetical protein [Clostridia bacterium]
MKKQLTLLLAASMVLSLAACTGNGDATDSGDGSSAIHTEDHVNTDLAEDSATTKSDATDTGEDISTPAEDTNTTVTEDVSSTVTESTEDTSFTEDESKPAETAKPAETEKPEHKHNYTSKVTSEAKCDKDGIKTFTCSCGDTYTEKIPAIDHTWGEWQQTAEPAYNVKGEETRTCKNCPATEKRDVASLTLDDVFKTYPSFVMKSIFGSLCYFDSADTLKVRDVFIWAQYHIKGTYVSETDETIYAVSDLDAFTEKYLGRTFDYSLATGSNGIIKVAYNEANQTVSYQIIVAAGGPNYVTEYVGYEQIDDTHFVIKYKTDYSNEIDLEDATLEIEKSGDNFIITAIKKA